ncbi:MAG: topoisomerase, partial [Rhodospirillales bacterium]|nr:topoisomerase [Rhodospirillales bacterium]
NIVDPRDAAESAGLTYVSDSGRGIRRRKAGKGFTYLSPGGEKITDKTTLARVRKLAVPPAWTDVWICPRPSGHIQATGRDARGRKQYRYHTAFREFRDATKYDHMMEFAASLGEIRRKISEHMSLRGLPREKVLATIVHLLERTLIRVGNEDYAKQNQSYGLTTLQGQHVKTEGSELRFRFKGKSGKQWNLRITDRRIAKIIRACQDLPGQDLFQYVGEDGEVCDISSSDVNAYLKEITGADVTAKDFRTWHGTVLAAMALQEIQSFDSQAAAKKNLKLAIEQVASRLGNTPTICRKCYIHPEILTSYFDGQLVLDIKEQIEEELRSRLSTLKPEEAAVLALLESRLKKTTKDKLADSLAIVGNKTPARRRSAKKAA